MNLSSFIICSLSSVDMNLSFGILSSNTILSVALGTVSKVFCVEIFQTFVILLTILFPIKSSVVSAVS